VSKVNCSLKGQRRAVLIAKFRGTELDLR